MTKAKLLIISEQTNVVKPYELLLKEFFGVVDTFIIDNKFPEFDTKKYDILLIDLYSKSFINEIERIEKKDIKIILITPYNPSIMINSIDFLEKVSLSLIKPVDVTKLIKYIQNESCKIERKNILEKKNNVLTKIIDLLPSHISMYDLSGKLYYANENFLKAHDLNFEHFDKITFDEITFSNLEFQIIKNKLEITKSFTIQKEIDSKWFESIFYMADFEYIVHSCSDITLQKQKEINLEQASVFYENSNEGILITDQNGLIVSVNRAFCKITGYVKSEVIGKTPSILSSGIHDKDFYITMWDTLKNNGSWQGEIWNKRKNGEIYPEWLSIAKAVNPKYNETFFIAIFTDITSLKEADKKLYYYANHDILTGLANRVQFEANLRKSIESAKRRNTKMALMFIDLDKFKEINDTYGHGTGDKMLKELAKRIEQSVRKEDFIARIGGDEFVLLLKDINEKEDVLNLAKKINDNVKEPLELDKKVFFMSLSIGISLYPEHAENSEDLIKYADAAMYEVKEAGRNGYYIYHQEMTDKVFEKLSLQNQLKVAMKRDEFEMYYQAMIDIKTNKILGAEALVRWNHPQRGVLTPIHFIDSVEDSSMNIDFGNMVIKKVLQDIQSINSNLANQNSFKVSINISAKQFFEDFFNSSLLNFCNDFLIEPKQIELELLETQIIKNSEISIKKIQELHKNGFTIAIDDFGTGYSSLSYLKNLKVDKLKIDQSFIKDLLIDKSDKAIVEAIIKLSKTFNLKVQAEGVESDEHYNLLKKMRCDLAQGYNFNKPMALNDFLVFLKEYNNG